MDFEIDINANLPDAIKQEIRRLRSASKRPSEIPMPTGITLYDALLTNGLVPPAALGNITTGQAAIWEINLTDMRFVPTGVVVTVYNVSPSLQAYPGQLVKLIYMNGLFRIFDMDCFADATYL